MARVIAPVNESHVSIGSSRRSRAPASARDQVPRHLEAPHCLPNLHERQMMMATGQRRARELIESDACERKPAGRSRDRA